MPAIRFNGNQSCRHRSASAINGFEDSNNRCLAESTEASNNGVVRKEENGHVMKAHENGQYESDFESLNASCSKCGLVWRLPPVSANKLGKNLQDNHNNVVNGGVHEHEDDNDNQKFSVNETNSVPLVKSRVSFFEEKMTFSKSAEPVVKRETNAHVVEALAPKENGLTNGLIKCKDAEKNNSDWKNFPKKLEDSPSKTGGCPFSGKKALKNIRLKNYVKGSQDMDNLHQKAKVGIPTWTVVSFTFIYRII